MICYLFPEPLYFFFSTDIPPLLYYSHIPTTIIAILMGLFVFFNGRKNLLNQLLLLISLCFSLWMFINLILWTNIHSEILTFAWSFLRVLSSLISILSIYFIYVFLEKKDISLALKLILFILVAPVIFFATTDLNISGFDITNCDAYLFEGYFYKLYYILLEVLAIIWIGVLLIKHYRIAPSNFKKQIVLMGIGIEFFLFTYFIVVFLSGYLTTIGILPDSRLELYGLFGMDVFMALIAVLIVRFKAFNIGLIGSQALIVALIILIGSQFTFVDSTITVVLTSVTLVITGMIGILLIRSVKKEISQREQIEELVVDLDRANERLKELDKMKSEFVSIASHQLRSPLTSIRGYASMLAEGSYGKLPVKVRGIVEKIADSSKFMALSVEDYLNVSRIEAGNMNYELSDFNLKDVAEKVVDELRPVAMKKGLVIVFRSDCDSGCLVHADIGKIRQVILNLIDNAIKYTTKGSITVVAHDYRKKKKMYVTIQDTGVGMSKETLDDVFDKFVRAKNANSVNVTGTGLGLFVARKMMTDMDGKVWAESEGEGKGSTFWIELPLLTASK